MLEHLKERESERPGVSKALEEMERYTDTPFM